MENPKINYKIFNNLAYGQWTLRNRKWRSWNNISKIHNFYLICILILKLTTILSSFDLFSLTECSR